MSEELVIRQAAPTLAGIKTGSFFPCPCEDKAALLAEIRAFNRRYQARGLCLLPLRFTKGKALLYLYRPAALQRDLDSDAAAKLLAGAGYPCGSCGGCVAALVRRMRSSAEFPHEVGLFLSYPPEDVKGFVENRAANAKCTGVWKVYGDERQARQTFAKYKKMYAGLLRALAVRLRVGQAGRRRPIKQTRLAADQPSGTRKDDRL